MHKRLVEVLKHLRFAIAAYVAYGRDESSEPLRDNVVAVTSGLVLRTYWGSL